MSQYLDDILKNEEQNKNEVQLFLPRRLVLEILYIFDAQGFDCSEHWQQLMDTLNKQKDNFTDTSMFDLFLSMRSALCEPANFPLHNDKFKMSYDLLAEVDKCIKLIANKDKDEWYSISVVVADGTINPYKIPARIYDEKEAHQEFRRSVISSDKNSEIVEIMLEKWSTNEEGFSDAGAMIKGHTYDRETYPSGLSSWTDTFYQLSSTYDSDHLAVQFIKETGGSVEVGNEFADLATQFETLHKTTVWDENGSDYYEEITKFMNEKARAFKGDLQ